MLPSKIKTTTATKSLPGANDAFPLSQLHEKALVWIGDRPALFDEVESALLAVAKLLYEVGGNRGSRPADPHLTMNKTPTKFRLLKYLLSFYTD